MLIARLSSVYVAINSISSFNLDQFLIYHSKMSTVSLLRLTAACVTAANKAGSLVRSIMAQGELGIVDKGVNDLQTEADRSAQRLIVGSITSLFPNITVIGEETLEPTKEDFKGDFDADVLKQTCPSEWISVPGEKIVVWVDPLDGTSEYTQGLLDHVTVLIGICVSGRPVAGVIHQPYFNYKTEEDTTGRTIWALHGLGAFGICKTNLSTEKGLIITTTRSHSSKLTNAAVDSLNPTEVLRVGGAGHKALLVIEGKAHAYVFASPGCKKWDTAAPEAVLTSLGGVLTDIVGVPLSYDPNGDHVNRTGVLATTDKDVHKLCLDAMPEPVKQVFMSPQL